MSSFISDEEAFAIAIQELELRTAAYHINLLAIPEPSEEDPIQVDKYENQLISLEERCGLSDTYQYAADLHKTISGEEIGIDVMGNPIGMNIGGFDHENY